MQGVQYHEHLRFVFQLSIDIIELFNQLIFDSILYGYDRQWREYQSGAGDKSGTPTALFIFYNAPMS